MDFVQHLQSNLLSLSPQSDKVLLAVSGGADSVAMLLALSQTNLRLEVAHLDHALRPESAADADFVAGLCEDLGLVLHRQRVDVAAIARQRRANLESTARQLRYSYLTSTAKGIGADATATAHTLDDQAETVLLQMLRGAAFLRGIPARRGKIVRPLLDITKAQLEAFLKAQGQSYRVDMSNADTRFSRNWLRHKLIPLLEQRYPQTKTMLARLATIQSEQQQHFHTLAKDAIKDAELSLDFLLQRDKAEQWAMLAGLFQEAGVTVDWEHLNEVQSRLAEPSFRVSLPQNKIARGVNGSLQVISALEGQRHQARLATSLPAAVDAAKASQFPDLYYRSRLAGDSIRLSGGRKKLSDALIDLKIPREDRDSLLLLASGQEVLWVQDLLTDVRVSRAEQSPHQYFMRLALAQAEAAYALGELPVGAVLVKDDTVLAQAHNLTEGKHDPSAHAELRVLREAAVQQGDWRLDSCTLYVTLEPCLMCYGAMLQAHLSALVYGAPNHRDGALGGLADVRVFPWKRSLQVEAGPMAHECARLLQQFFAERRAS